MMNSHVIRITEAPSPVDKVKINQLTTGVHAYWEKYGRCISCKTVCRHELHLYNHYMKYHGGN